MAHPIPSPSAEYETVRLAARAHLTAERARALDGLAAGPLDWEEVLRLGAFHKTLPLLHAHLRRHPDVPDNVTAALLRRARRAAASVLFLSSEMAQIADRLEADDVPYLVLKGPSLSDAYGGLANRPFVDNDLLVRREDFGRVEASLLALGFSERKRSDVQQSRYLSVHGEYTFGRSVGPFGSTVDVHTRLVHAGYSYAPPLERLRRRSRPITVAGATVPALGWDDLFLALSVNALKDQWDRMRLASDIGAVAECVADWPAVLRMAERGRVLRAVHLAVLLAADLVDGAFPAGVLARARADGRAVSLAAFVQRTMAAGGTQESMSGLDRARLNLGVQDGLRGQLRYSGYAAVRRATERWVTPHAHRPDSS